MAKRAARNIRIAKNEFRGDVWIMTGNMSGEAAANFWK